MGLFDLFKKKPVQQNSAQLSNEEKYGKAWLTILAKTRHRRSLGGCGKSRFQPNYKARSDSNSSRSAG